MNMEDFGIKLLTTQDNPLDLPALPARTVSITINPLDDLEGQLDAAHAQINDDTPTGLIAQAKEFVRLETIEKELKAQLKEIDERQKELERGILEQFAMSGMEKLSIDGMTVYPYRQLWAGAAQDEESGATTEASRAAAIQGLRDAGLEAMVFETFNVQTLSAYVRELPLGDDNMPLLPPELQTTIRVSEKFSVRTTKSGRKKGH